MGERGSESGGGATSSGNNNGDVALEELLDIGGGEHKVREREGGGAVGHHVRIVSGGAAFPRKQERLAREGAPDERFETVEKSEVEAAVPEPVSAGVEGLVEGDEIAGPDGSANWYEDVAEAGGLGPREKRL